jgi:hypothetical protein
MSNGSTALALRYRRLLLILCAVALGGYHIFASAVMYPVPTGDAVVFMPPAINLKAGRGLTNPLWKVNPDPTGQHRYLEHPPLFQMVVSACMRTTETKNAFIVLAIFNALTLALYAAFLCTAKFAQRLMSSLGGFVVLLSSVFALAFMIFTDASGRPEALSTLVLSLALAVVTWLPRKYWAVCLGIAIGVAAAIHPVHGIFIACLVAMAFLFTAPLRQAIRNMMLAAAIALPLFWLLLSLSPYPVAETLHAVSKHAAFANGSDDPLSGLLVFYFKLVPWAGFYLLGLSLVLICFCLYFWRSSENRATRWTRVTVLCLTALAFWFFSVRRPSASYYLMMLAPALAAGALYLFDARGGTAAGRKAALPLCVLLAFFSVFGLCLVRDIALFVDYRTGGVSFAEARKEFGDLARSTNQTIYVSESLWVLSDEFERIRIVERGTASGDLMVLQQTQRGSLSPPVIPGYRLLAQRFVTHQPTCFGLPIGRTMPGYSFAVFAREISLGENRPRRSPESFHFSHGS